MIIKYERLKKIVKKKKKEPKNRQIGWFWLNIFQIKKIKCRPTYPNFVVCYANQTISCLGLKHERRFKVDRYEWMDGMLHGGCRKEREQIGIHTY